MAQVALPFTWAQHCLPYLEIQLTANISDLFTANYPDMLKQMTDMLLKWPSLPLSWFRKINAIEMAILPKFLYLFRVLPISVPAYFL